MYCYTQLEAFRNTPKLVDLVDVDSQKWQDCADSSLWPLSWLHRLEAQRVRRLENQICQRADHVFVISEDELSTLQQANPHTNALVAGNGVDTHYFSPSGQVNSDDPICCFIGVLNYFPNVDGLVWFANEIWPRIRAQHSNARLQIVGKSPNHSVLALANSAGVEVYADVPDVRPYLENSSAVIAPLRIARGVQNKVLEAMAMGRPVVASRAALTGIHARPNHELLMAESTEDWESAILRLLTDETQRSSLGTAAQEYVVTHHDWQESLVPFGEALSIASHHAEPAKEVTA